MRITTQATSTAALFVIALAAAGCGESTSRARSTSPAASQPSDHAVATAETDSATPVAEPASEEPASSPAGAEATERRAEAASHETVHASNGLTLRRLVVAHDVENREPVGSAEPFEADGEPIFAFIEMANGSDEAQRILVTFEREDGRAVGPISLEIPANAPRWRTWARSSWLRRPGSWTAVVRTEEGEILQSVQFEIES